MPVFQDAYVYANSRLRTVLEGIYNANPEEWNFLIGITYQNAILL